MSRTPRRRSRRLPRTHARARRASRRRPARAPGRPAHEPAGLGPRAHRRLRGPLARPPPRRRAAAARRPRRALRRLRDAARRARRHRAARRAPARASTSPPCASARSRALERAAPTPCCTRWSSATSSSTPRRCARRCALGGLLAAGRARAARPLDGGAPTTGSSVPGGRRSRIGAAADGFAYDNERPRHARRARRLPHRPPPVTNATWLHFAEGGGYERREWWSDEGWAWKEDYDITHCPAQRRGTRTRRSCHVSWFEADAFARAHGARLPTEAEWEKAATWDPRRTLDGHRARLGVDGVARSRGYPGFVAHPYREYSEVFFGDALPRPARRLVGDAPARRHPDVPQLGPPPAPADLRRRAARHDAEET